MYTKMRNDASTFNINQDLPEKFALPGVKIWRGSDSVIKNAKDFVPKPITGAAVPQVGAAVPQVQGQAETAIPPPPQDTGSLAPQTGGKGDQVAHCGSDFVGYLGPFRTELTDTFPDCRPTAWSRTKATISN